ncbi:MAG TPA: hypothetical protein VHC19_29330 [Pirellulales bacterium]|nr:hypothetical protein [Pirellulales bacterium]
MKIGEGSGARAVEMGRDELFNAVVQHAQADMAEDRSMWHDAPQADASETPSTSSLMWGLWREGLKDMQNAVLDPWNGQTATHEEPGTIANPTQAMVTQDIGTVHGYHHDAYLDQVAAQHIEQPEPQIEIGE